MDVGKIKARNITTLMDDDGISIPPTKRNIMKAFDELTRKCQPGDCAFVHYSGKYIIIRVFLCVLYVCFCVSYFLFGYQYLICISFHPVRTLSISFRTRKSSKGSYRTRRIGVQLNIGTCVFMCIICLLLCFLSILIWPSISHLHPILSFAHCINKYMLLIFAFVLNRYQLISTKRDKLLTMNYTSTSYSRCLAVPH